jgi:glycolate oxidase iron-sulfur subunit
MAVARGRNTLCREVIEGRLALRRDLGPAISECLLCRACTANCFPAVRTDEIVVAARADYAAQVGRPLLLQFLFREMLPNPRRMTRLMRLLGLGKRTGLSGLARVARILGLFGKEVERADEIMHKVPGEFLRDRLPKILPPVGRDAPAGRLYPEAVRHAPRVGDFIGCGVNFAVPQAGEACVRFMLSRGVQVVPLDNCCCGLPPYAYGDLEAARRLAAQNLALLDGLELDAIVTDCASCSSFLKDYPRLLAGEPALAEKAKAVQEKTADFTVFAQDLLARAETTAEGAKATQRHRIVTWHDPCHLSRYQTITAQPRALLRAIPGLEFRELPEADWCCGGAGSYSIAHYDLSMRILDRKMQNLARTGADLLVTACPSCILQLSHGVRRAGLNVEVRHIGEVLV